MDINAIVAQLLTQPTRARQLRHRLSSGFRRDTESWFLKDRLHARRLRVMIAHQFGVVEAAHDDDEEDEIELLVDMMKLLLVRTRVVVVRGRCTAYTRTSPCPPTCPPAGRRAKL